MHGLILAIKHSLFLKFRPNLRFRFISHFLHSSSLLLQLHECTSIAPPPIDILSRLRTTPYIATGHSSHAPKVFDEMPHREQQGSKSNLLLPDAFKIVKYATERPSATNAAVAHAFAVKQGALSHLRTSTSLLTVYSRCNELGSSLDLFDEVFERDVIFWNAVMSACLENDCSESAVGVFKKMVGEGNEFDATSLVAVASAYSSLKELRKGQVLHGLSIKSGMEADTILRNALIDMYAKCGDLISSELVFWEAEIKDVVTWNSIISGCFYGSHPEKSLQYVKRMASCETRPDSISISCALAACTTLQELDFGLSIHCWATKLGYAVTSHVSVSNSLISFYAQVRDVFAAECVFREMTVKNVVSWNALIKGFFLNEEAVAAFRLLRDMQLVASIQPDMATIITIVPFCAELMLLGEGKAIHGFVIRRGMASEVSVINSLINMYSKCSKLKEAECLFLNMPRKDLVSWNTMIFGYAQIRLYPEAQMLFKKMLVSCSAFTLPTLLAILPSCDSLESLPFGRSIHGWSIKMGFLNQTFALNSLMHMYISCEALSDAFALFRFASVKFDATSWNTIIAGCSNRGYFSEALRYFELMRRQAKFHCSSIVFGSVISACGNLGLPIKGRVVHGLALTTGASADIRVQNSLVTMYGRLGDTESARLAFNLLSHGHNLCSWNCVISAMSQNEDAKKALELFRSLEFEPNEITISTILSACAQLGAMSYGKQIHGHVFRSKLNKNPFITASLIEMYSNGGKLDVAEKVFLSSPEKTATSWNSLISAYGFHNFGSKAIETFEEMIRNGVCPTGGSFTSLLSACSHSGLVEEGKAYYDKMTTEFKVGQTVEHHVCMVDMLGRKGRIREARGFIENLPTRGEAGVWGALLSACSYHGEMETGREAAEMLFAMEPENGSYYVALCNMYVGAGKWEEAVELRRVMEEKQLKKQTGYSYIDVGLR